MSLVAPTQVDQRRDLLRGVKISHGVDWRVILSQVNSAACKGTISVTILVTRRSLTAISDHMAKR